ncbi:DEAD/DEAH box helicase family protein [Plebeiibacterium marinum]|uniref:DEAD/DEAH box helicase family protein n=1 Tax=Plebeiibacterium marinum TaxID=2992111 RepID=A0AAE3MIC3_9BACT|nr:DEAD/DEAH box helicase family protein [Plebeiobacterium marinum]MCW3808064.1 DEAD/DEAH box helicase family protein [Plebeiobacterium marinum]
MQSNFLFLQSEWNDIYIRAIEVEKNAITAPITSAFYARLCLERMVHWLYENEGYLKQPYQTKLAARMAEPTFKEIIPPSIYNNLDYIRKQGNIAAHGGKIDRKASLACLRFLFRFLSWTSKMYSEVPPEIVEFNEDLIPKVGASEKSKHELKKAEKKLSEQINLANDERKKRLLVEEENAKLKIQLKEIEERKERNQPIALPPEQYSESETRSLYIDVMLQEAGWNPEAINTTEYRVIGMPKSVNPTGKGYVDYVLWGNNGLPLAVIEAKKASRNINEGKHQAELYANCLENMTGQRPVIYYTNGFDTEIWDDCTYPPRRVFGFYTKDELQQIINRRKDKKDPRIQSINNKITNRAYQKHAIASILNKFIKDSSNELRGGSRAALAVMATGTGKTRTAISFVDVLFKSGWISRVLFLADRNALVTQAQRNFNALLPNLSSVNLTKEKEDKNTRLVFSTYPTIMNCIDGIRSGDERFYSVGHFDLIIVDEAHRSIYQKYGAIFKYFDALRLGLTATPKEDGDHDTYHLFDEETNNPTFDYELEEAVNEKYLVPFHAQEINLGFMSRGINFDDLSEEEQEQYEETFRDESGYMPDSIDSSAIHNWLFNNNTVDKALNYLMTQGIKVEEGDKIGKSIIFAKSHQHAEFIEERFNAMYPELGNKFLRIIDNYEKYAQDLLDDFSLKDKYPQIAVSVDMLDTGVDVPEIVNLVLFKPVYSKSKFWQMLGRGTRLCPDLFAPGIDKEYFYVFDFCNNFQFFSLKPEGRKANKSDSLSAKIFKTTISIAEAFREEPFLDENHQQARKELLNWAYQRVCQLNLQNFMVRMELKYVEKYNKPDIWQNLNDQAIFEIFNHIAPLIFIPEKDEAAKRFDLLMRNFQLALIESKPTIPQYENTIKNIGQQLSRLLNIGDVANQKSIIKAIKDDNFWQDKNYNKLENIRLSLRDLLKYLPKEETLTYKTDFLDEIENVNIIEDPLIGYTKSDSYKLRVETYIRENKNHLTIQKLRNNIPLTSIELDELERLIFLDSKLGTKEDYLKTYGEKPLGVFIRSIIGMDEEAIQKAFSNFIDEGNLTADQIQFLKMIIGHFTKNGFLELKELSTSFKNAEDNGLFELFEDEDQDHIIRTIDEVNNNAVVG